MEERQAIECYVSRTGLHAAHIGVRCRHLVGVSVAGDLGQPRGATGVEVSSDVIGSRLQRRLQLGSAIAREQRVKGVSAAGCQHRNTFGTVRQTLGHAQGLVPKIGTWHRPRNEDQFGLCLQHQVVQRFLTEQRVDRVGNTHAGRGPEQILALRNIRQQHRDYRSTGASEVQNQARRTVDVRQ
ncbi:hypothetical protein D3C86_1519600 [compost metagenome]